MADDSDALRVALSMVRADWQQDDAGWDQLWAAADDKAAVARELSRISRQTLERLAGVAGISTAEMLHRMAGLLIPHPEPANASFVDLTAPRERT